MIYVSVIVLTVIFCVLFSFLLFIDYRLRKLEKASARKQQ